ncbi:MAG: twin-arginine translocase TatA/TatE family subunit [Hyphomicrobiaceae bacterium]
MGSMSLSHWLIVLAIVLLVFGAGKIPQLMGDMAKGIKTFKKGMQDDDDVAKKPDAPAATPTPPKPLEHAAKPYEQATKPASTAEGSKAT